MRKPEERQVFEFLRDKDGRLYHREGQELEFKEQFNFGGIAEYLRDFSAFANNRGGFLIFGVTDSPRKAQGLSDSAADQFDKIDPQRISGYILDKFSSDIDWCHDIVKYKGKTFGYFFIRQHLSKPVICKKDEGKELRSGDIYYRYGGRTQRIQAAELENIIQGRIQQTNEAWQDLMNKIGRVGAANAAILDTEAGLIEKGQNQILIVDDELVKKISFIKEGHFSESEGATTLKLVGDVVPVNRVEVVKKEKEHLIKAYPLSAKELASAIKKRMPDVGMNEVWAIIRENNIKSDTDYSAFNFRNKNHEDIYRESGKIASGTPSIYKEEAVDFICKILEDEQIREMLS